MKIWRTLGRCHDKDYLTINSQLERLRRIDIRFNNARRKGRPQENLVYVPFEISDAQGLIRFKTPPQKTKPHISTDALVDMYVVDRNIGRKRIVVPSFDDVFEAESEWLLLNGNRVHAQGQAMREDQAVANDGNDLADADLDVDDDDTSCDGTERKLKNGETLDPAAIGPIIVFKEATTQTKWNIPMDFDIPDDVDVRAVLERGLRELTS